MVREKRGLRKKEERGGKKEGNQDVIGDTQQEGCLLSLKEVRRETRGEEEGDGQQEEKEGRLGEAA